MEICFGQQPGYTSNNMKHACMTFGCYSNLVKPSGNVRIYLTSVISWLKQMRLNQRTACTGVYKHTLNMAKMRA